MGTAAVASLWTRERAGRAGWGSGPGGGDLVGAWEAGEGRDGQAGGREKREAVQGTTGADRARADRKRGFKAGWNGFYKGMVVGTGCWIA